MKERTTKILVGRWTRRIATKNDDGRDDGYVCNILVYVQRGVLYLHDYEQLIVAHFHADYQ